MTTPASKVAAHRHLLALAAIATLSAGCSSVSGLITGDRIDYRSQAGKTAPLEVPPDLTQLSRDSRFRPQGGVVSASTAATGAAAAATANPTRVALQAAGELRIERQGQQRWLVAPGVSPEQLWPQLQAFWQERGFTLEVQDAAAGIMETNWAENRAKLPQDMIRRTLGSVLDQLYSTGERDRFRTRIERGSNGTEVFISHRGMEEVFSDGQRDRTVWRPRAADAELEAEMLARLLVKLGTPADAARTAVAQAPERSPQARPVVAGTPAATPAAATGATQMELSDGFDRAWRRVGLALDRAGYTVEDRDRAAGLYFVRYVAPGSSTEPGFFSRLFGGGTVQPPARYRVLVKAEGDKSRVSVQNAQGAPETGEVAQKIIASLLGDLR